MTYTTELGKILTFQRGFDLPSSKRFDGDYPIISSSGFTGNHNEYKCDGENVVTGRYGTIGEVYYYAGKCWPLNTSLFVKDFKSNNARYIYYLLKHVLKIDGKDKSTVPGVDRNVLHTMKVPFIQDVEKQKRIISILESIDNKITVNTKINENLAKQMQTLYDYWFTQYDFPDENGNPYHSSGGEMVYNEILNQKIPQGWKAIDIQEIAKINSGYAFSSEDYSQSGKYRLITIKNVKNDGIDLDVDNFIETIPINMPEYCKLKTGDILMSLTGNVGRVGIMFSENCLLNQRVAVIEPINTENKFFIYNLFKGKYLKASLLNLANGSSQANLSPVETEKIKIAYNRDITVKYNNIVLPLINEMTKNLQENQKLSQLRDWLLPLLMNEQAIILD